ncbi:MAG: adenylate kinase [Bacteroidales bacterium]|jgi:adenylate kinase|nr:adenylate kinase [Bacteroidales bacterium]OPZ99464.1 MAG: Adenylate kinase [Bacteroidetes bacterium ADurb.Bin416]HBL73222.1 adenylate kinase [Bacteroidales bacterium]
MVLNLVLFGAPGSGKGTQSTLLAEKYGLVHLSTGELLREEVQTGSDLGQQIDAYIAKGNLVPDRLIIDMLAAVLARYETAKGFIFDGFPRTTDQAAALRQLLKANHSDVSLMINLNVEEEELINRLLYRGISSGRTDDNYETIQHRIKVYHEKTAPVKAFYEAQGCAVDIEGVGSLSDIFKRIQVQVDAVINNTHHA